jgi:IS4 transposase
MLLRGVLERFEKKSPFTVMAHLSLSRALAPEWVNDIFEKHSDGQYTRELLFSTAVDVMSLVALGMSPSVHAAAKGMGEQLTVSLTSLYNKINGVHTAVVRALVSGSAEKFLPVMEELAPKGHRSVKGLRLRIVDGNHLAASEKRLKPLRAYRGAALPGQSLVVYDPDIGLVLDLLPWEDAHAQERLIMQTLLPRATKGELWIADRNFCCAPIILGFIDRDANFLVREHAINPNPKVESKLRSIGRVETGRVYEQIVSIKDDKGEVRRLRRIELHLYKETEDGDKIIRLLTNVPASTLNAKRLAELYRRRWRIEAMFQRLEHVLESEVKSLGQPRAALFAFGVSALAYNVLAILMAAVRVKHASKLEQSKIELSPYYIAIQLRASYAGLLIVAEQTDWEPYESLSPKKFAKTLVGLAANVDPKYFRSYPRKPKAATRKGYVSRSEVQQHVATSQVLEAGHIV